MPTCFVHEKYGNLVVNVHKQGCLFAGRCYAYWHSGFIILAKKAYFLRTQHRRQLFHVCLCGHGKLTINVSLVTLSLCPCQFNRDCVHMSFAFLGVTSSGQQTQLHTTATYVVTETNCRCCQVIKCFDRSQIFRPSAIICSTTVGCSVHNGWEELWLSIIQGWSATCWLHLQLFSQAWFLLTQLFKLTLPTQSMFLLPLLLFLFFLKCRHFLLHFTLQLHFHSLILIWSII